MLVLGSCFETFVDHLLREIEMEKDPRGSPTDVRELGL